MKFDKSSDILLNIIIPLLLGILIYWAGNTIIIPALIRNYLPDSFWAYAFLSSILIIWDRKINITWFMRPSYDADELTPKSDHK